MQRKIAELEKESSQPSTGLVQKMEVMKVQFRAKCRQEVRAQHDDPGRGGATTILLRDIFGT